MKLITKYLLFAALAVFALASCKKEEEESQYLSGTIELEYEGCDKIPLYVQVGETYTFTPTGLSADDAKIGYYLTHPVTSVKDTIMTPEHPATKFVFEIPDTLAYLTLSITAFAYDTDTKYYTSGTSTGFYVVKDGINTGSITEFNTKTDSEEIAGKSYYVTKIGDKTWMRQNLSYFGEGGVESKEFGIPYCDCKAMENIFGGFYTWEEAQKACPDGWHLPTEAEWCSMMTAIGAKDAQPYKEVAGVAGKLMDYVYFNGTKLWDYWGFDVTNESLFTAIPTGYVVELTGGYVFSTFQEYACYWTADEYDGHGVYRYIQKDKNIVYAGAAEKDSFWAAVRCVK